ncbi:MAG: NADH-quinone oxidoreductase subunit NuoK [Dehalococcoidia bacterium]|nr:NADH-quinone oxidoreductase subunit NuoK [Dehalococcoidia bacterium]MXY87790.1 NADH-quinone oxidoreductase subunit NuoK [Dehalococcoidia bacterium]MXZ89168.1 NADH-quinone oxidoreductase subunit NuoK [Dehalococcoidia bacterium]MYA51999.1 NADH-quinone oxidoreductase subunit NuoK [Dehalococcoidia bacterium]MYH67637.1 NADH-quinone oxidoreductase subunit NuoK [Dehalococcoidia bacterium]
MVPMENYLILSGILFSLGVYGVLARRNAVLVLMSVELMLNAVSLNFVAFSAYLDPDKATGIIFAVFVIAVAAAEVGLALAIVIRLFRNRSTANVDEAATMRW